MDKPVAVFDTECFPNYWLLKFGPGYTFSVQTGQSLDSTSVATITQLFDTFTVISFNGTHYDVPLIGAALSGFSCEQLKWVSDQIIVCGVKPWELEVSQWKPRDHIDIMEVLPGTGSQKQYAGRIHCKTMRDLPYEPDRHLSPSEMAEVESYCENDLLVLSELYAAITPQLHLRNQFSTRYGIDLRSKSDAQLGEAVIKFRCEQALKRRIYKPEIDWNLKFRYEAPSFLQFGNRQCVQAFDAIKQSVFTLGASGSVVMPPQLEGLQIELGKSAYRLGIGGLHSSEKCQSHKSDSQNVIRDIDVASYYPNLIINSGRFPIALGPTFGPVYGGIKEERIQVKAFEKTLSKDSPEWLRAHSENEGLKVAINGPFGKLGSPFSVLFAPEMLIQTTITGQLAILMLIEWLEVNGIPVISANTDGIVINCPRSHISLSEQIIKRWEQATALEMEASEYASIYSRDVNNYFAVKANGEVKRKGEYSKAGLVEKKNPDVEICGDAVAELLSEGTPLLYTIAACRDIRKFVAVRKVAGGAVKLWGEGPRKGISVTAMIPLLLEHGWSKDGRKWSKEGVTATASDAYKSCFVPQRPEYIGKVIRYYYSTAAPGSIIYNTNGNSVSLSNGAKPCMTLPDSLPDDIDYEWYLRNCESILKDIGYA